MYRINMLLCSVLLAFVPRLTSEDKKPPVPFDDGAFVVEAASGNLHEIELGKIAAIKGKDDGVRKFGQRMIDDHVKANDGLRLAAKAASIAMPDRINPNHQQEVERFKNYAGENFDLDYSEYMVKDHERQLTAFTQASKESKNKPIREFATAMLPVLAEQAKLAKELPKQGDK